MLGVVVAVRIWNAVVYDLIGQHDVEIHVGYLRDLAAGRLPTTYSAPWYYLLTCVLASPAVADPAHRPVRRLLASGFRPAGPPPIRAHSRDQGAVRIAASLCFLLLWIGSLVFLGARRVVRPGQRPLGGALTVAAVLPLLASPGYLGAAALRFYAPVDGDIAKWEYIVWVFVFLPIPIVQAVSSLEGQPARCARAALLACAAVGCVQSAVTTAC